MVGCAIPLEKRKPEWVSTLLRTKFFSSCADHGGFRKSEKNMFCVDCNTAFCKHCFTYSRTPHGRHGWFQICKYVYHHVVRLQDIQKHLDCSKIQTYKINGEKAVHLNPRPQPKDTKISKSKGGATCEACGRHIQDLPNSFCSIACKVSLVGEMYSIPIPEFDNLTLKETLCDVEGNAKENQSFASLRQPSEAIQPCLNSNKLKPKKFLHKRKGVPRRAPLR